MRELCYLAFCLESSTKGGRIDAYHRMGLAARSRSAGFDASEALALSAADTKELLGLHAAGYPGNWFVPRML